MHQKLFLILIIFLLLLAGCAPAPDALQPDIPVSATASSEPSVAPTVMSAPQDISTTVALPTPTFPYNIVDTGQGKCYDNSVEVT